MSVVWGEGSAEETLSAPRREMGPGNVFFSLCKVGDLSITLETIEES